MFYIVNDKDELIREGEKRMTLRRVIRKSPDKELLRIIEGSSLVKALKVKIGKVIKLKTVSKKTKAAKPKATKKVVKKKRVRTKKSK